MGTFNVYNVKTDYGALGNGSSDDTEAIQNAINGASSTNGIVYFPAGTYIISLPHCVYRSPARFVWWVSANRVQS